MASSAAITRSLVAPPMLVAAAASDTVRVPALLTLPPLFSANQTEWSLKTTSNGSRLQCMQVVDPLKNLRYETLSYLPPLSPEAIAKEVEHLLQKGWIPCLEFDKVGVLYRKHLKLCGYYDGRYWTMWKLPMFGCQDPAQVLAEIEECKKAYPDCFIRVLGFDNIRQVQCSGFVVYKPTTALSS
ncbi:hypothetical protein O6H91_06G076900 [Diphasiastrum complanatum]|uniref:Uncharacterized protein n=1 Tax=Diphasiastrum complanatum TaxID=34168 RepID=A0ACC2DFN8_DIPCM|nr:hypothetical protein O6H91_06G076900 [Diphasiastrum complanatum]